MNYPEAVHKWWELNKGKTFKRPKGRKTYTVMPEHEPQPISPGGGYGYGIRCLRKPEDPIGGNEPLIPYNTLRAMVLADDEDQIKIF